MFNVNTPLMEKVVQANDEGITNLLQQADTDKAATYFDYAPQDAAMAQGIQKDYANKIDYATNQLRGNYANWRNQMAPVRALTDQLTNDYRTGAISKIAGNAAARQQYFAQADAMGKLYNESKVGEEKGLPQDYVELFKAKWDRDYKGAFNQASNTWNTYQGGVVPRYHNVNKELEDGLDKVLADEGYTHTKDPYGNSMYMREEEHTWKQISPQKLLEAMKANITPEMQDYLAQMSTVGVVNPKSLQGDPYKYDPHTITPDEQAILTAKGATLAAAQKDSKHYSKDQLAALQQDIDDTKKSFLVKDDLHWNTDNYFAGPMLHLLNKYSGGNVDKHSILWSEDPVQTKRFEVAHADARAAADLNLRAQQFQYQKDHDKITDFMKQEEIDNQQVGNYGGGTKSVGGGAGTLGPQQFPTNTMLSTKSAHDLAGLPKTPGGRDQLSVDGLNEAVATAKNNYAKASQQYIVAQQQLRSLPNTPANAALIAAAQNSSDQAVANMKQYQNDAAYASGQINVTTGMVLGNQLGKTPGDTFSTQDADMYKKYSANSEAGYKDLGKQIQTLNNYLMTHAGAGSTPKSQMAVGINDIEAARTKRDQLMDEQTHYLDVKKRVKTATDNVYTSTRNTTDVGATAASLRRNDSYFITHAMQADGEGNTIRDMGTMQPIGDKTDISDVVGTQGKTGYSMSLVGENNLNDYLQKYGGEMYVTDIKQHGLTNNGRPVAVMSFRDPNGLLNGKRFLVDLNPNVSNIAGMRLANSTDGGVSKLGYDILNPTKTDVLYQVENGLKPIMQGGTTGTPGTNSATFPVMVNVPSSGGNQRVPLSVTASANYSNKGGWLYTVSINQQQPDGSVKPVPLQKLKEVDGKIVPDNSSKIPGLFSTPDDIAETVSLNEQRYQQAQNQVKSR
jgi:hypothetical protein